MISEDLKKLISNLSACGRISGSNFLINFEFLLFSCPNPLPFSFELPFASTVFLPEIEDEEPSEELSEDEERVKVPLEHGETLND